MKIILITINTIFLVLNLAVLWANRPLLLVHGIGLVIGTAVIIGLVVIETKKPEITEEEIKEWMG